MDWIIAYELDDARHEIEQAEQLTAAIDRANELSEQHEIVCVFRNRPGWKDDAPRWLRDRRDKTDIITCGLDGLIDGLTGDWVLVQHPTAAMRLIIRSQTDRG